MITYKSPKEWAIAKGYPVKPGKGRMPTAISLEWKSLLANGEVALEDKTSTPRPKKVETKTEAVYVPPPVKKSKPIQEAPVDIVELAPRVHSEATRAFANIDGKKVEVSMRNSCFTCDYALGWCTCGTPSAIVGSYGYLPVFLEV